MSSETPVRIISFVRNDANGQSWCEIRVFDDGSACMTGDDVGATFEESKDADKDAVKYVESKGFVRRRER